MCTSIIFLFIFFYFLYIYIRTLSQCYDSLSIFQFSEIDLSQLLYSFWRVGIIMSKLKINYALIKYIDYIFIIRISYIQVLSHIRDLGDQRYFLMVRAFQLLEIPRVLLEVLRIKISIVLVYTLYCDTVAAR